MNEFAPQHSRLFKEVCAIITHNYFNKLIEKLIQMITVCKPSKPFQYTVKNTPRRQVITNAYAEEIKALYDAVADSTQSSIPPPVAWDSLSTLDFVRLVINKVLNHAVQEDDDIFQRGCDRCMEFILLSKIMLIRLSLSLQATWIRNSLLRALRDSADIDARHLGDNFVYVHPTISSLSSFIHAVATGITDESMVSTESREAAMKALVEKYTSSGFPAYKGVPFSNGIAKPHGDTVLVTGTTGALGAYLLAELVENPAVTRIYALNRKSTFASLGIKERQEKALLGRGLKASAIPGSDKVRLLEADLALPTFGLAIDLYEEVGINVFILVSSAHYRLNSVEVFRYAYHS